MSAACKSCGAPMIWATSPRGAALPLDAAPVVDLDDPRPTSRTILYHLEDGNAVPVDQTAPGFLPAYLSHFATCPNAASHSKKGKR